MKLLLDTHTFIWWDSQPSNLSQTVLRLLRDPANDVMVSVVSLWEIVIKLQAEKLTLRAPLLDVVQSQQQSNNLRLLSVRFPHILKLETLPLHHRDPFDRLLIAQAIAERAVLVSKDREFTAYSVKTIW